MINVKLRIPFDAFARQQMLTEMHRRNRVSVSGDERTAGIRFSETNMKTTSSKRKAYVA